MQFVFKKPAVTRVAVAPLAQSVSAAEEEPLPVDVPRLPAAGFSSRAAAEYLREQISLPLAQRPQTPSGEPLVPEMPWDLDKSPIGEIVRLIGEYTKLANYLDEHLAFVEADSADADTIAENVSARVHISKGGTIADKKAKTVSDPAYVEAQQDQLTRAAIAKLIKAKMRSAERCISALSRALSGKEAEIKRHLT